MRHRPNPFRGTFRFVLLLITLVVFLITYGLLTTVTVDSVTERPIRRRAVAGPPRMFHIAMTTSDGVYSAWQARIMYYWFKKAKAAAGANGEMGGFTRILHSVKPDKLMDEIPTFVVDPLPEGMDRGYIVLNRPWAFVQWLEKANIKEDYIFMAEPDHIIVKPIPNLAVDGLAAAFPFFYIQPQKYERIIRKFFPKELGRITKIDPIGSSPVIIDKASLMKIAPTWMNVSLAINNDTEAKKVFDWGKPTYGNGEWRFYKRLYTSLPPPKNLTLPPKGTPNSVVTLVKMIKEAIENIPNWEDL